MENTAVCDNTQKNIPLGGIRGSPIHCEQQISLDLLDKTNGDKRNAKNKNYMM